MKLLVILFLSGNGTTIVFLESLLTLTQQTCLDEDVLKTSSRRLDQDEYGRFSLPSSEEDALALHLLQDVLKNVFKTFSSNLQDVFETYHQVKLFFLTRL